MMLGELHLPTLLLRGVRAVRVEDAVWVRGGVCAGVVQGDHACSVATGRAGGIAGWGSASGVGAQGRKAGGGTLAERQGWAAHLCSVRSSMRICLRSCSAQPSATTLSAYRLRVVVRCRTSLTKPELPSPSTQTSSRDLSHSTPPSPLGPLSEEEAAAGVPPGERQGRALGCTRVCVPHRGLLSVTCNDFHARHGDGDPVAA